ncbi:hypothetical protein Ancab_003473 [Ancistrocladus abbreviatus]
MLKEAIEYIKSCLGGTTAAIKRLQEVMGIAIPSTLRERAAQCLRDEERWVVFVGPLEHHSNLLSWRQSLAQVVEIGLAEDGLMDIEALRVQLEHYKDTGRPMLGSFSACSNVTGICSDTRALATLLHEYGAFACFDFAASGSYVEIDMRSGEINGYDGIFICPHKFVGGVGSPGILLMSKDLYLLKSSPPLSYGGGTVSYVNGFSEQDTLYFEDIEERENAGTPQIIQTIKAAMAFWVKEYIGYRIIEEQETTHIQTALERLGKNRSIKILGNTCAKRQAILSFLVYPAKKAKPLHGPFIAKLLNDLFGIQAEEDVLVLGYVGVKPRWVRISFPYYMSKEEVNFVLEAVELIADYGQRFLPFYHFDWKTGSWSFKKKAFREVPAVGKENKGNFHNYLALQSSMQGLNLKCYEPKECKKDATVKGKDTNCYKYASYLEIAMYIATLFPKSSNHQVKIPEDLEIKLPFIT